MLEKRNILIENINKTEWETLRGVPKKVTECRKNPPKGREPQGRTNFLNSFEK